MGCIWIYDWVYCVVSFDIKWIKCSVVFGWLWVGVEKIVKEIKDWGYFI